MNLIYTKLAKELKNQNKLTVADIVDLAVDKLDKFMHMDSNEFWNLTDADRYDELNTEIDEFFSM